ncbi:MAG: hypothetical protein H7222_17005 [Methylotenera sp.]|nr:hypothetical protein [Oligoflexia bacterium]
MPQLNSSLLAEAMTQAGQPGVQKPEDLDEAHYGAYMRALDANAISQTRWTPQALMELVMETKDALASAIDSQSEISSKDKAEMKSDLADLNYMGMAHYTRQSHADLMSFKDTCGQDGLRASAFFSADQGAVIICPGLLTLNFGRITDIQSLKRALQIVLAHELGHSIDNSEFPKSFKKLISCFDSQFRNMNSGNKIGGKDAKRELVADYWSSLSQVQIAKKGALAPELAAQTFIEGYSIFCSQVKRSGNDPHPAELARIYLHASNPEVRAYLGCVKPLPEVAGCSLSGPVGK